MLHRFVPIAAAVLTCAGCGGSASPALDGRDALGLPIYKLDGDHLAQLEAIANSNCAGGTRPYYRSVTGTGGDVTITYTCE